MKKLILFFFLINALVGFSQQDLQYTQFMYNKLIYNPAYAGSSGSISATALARKQWLGIEGAPSSQVISMDASLYDQRVGLGFNLVRNSIGITNRYDFDAAYAYQVPFGKGSLGLGIQGTIRYLKADFSDERLIAIQAPTTDAAIPMGMQSKVLPNFGAGIYYNDDNLYLGISAPRLIENNIDFAQQATVVSREVRHFYFMGGYLLNLSKDVQLQPQVLVKYTEHIPVDVDLNFNVIFSRKYTLGSTFRVGGSSEGGPIESVDLLFSAKLKNNLIFGISYDITVSQLRDYNSGSIEGMVRYIFKGEEEVEEPQEAEVE